MAESRLRRLLSHVTPAGTGLAAAAAVARPVSGSATVRKVGIIMNGVTGRMGTNQHLLRSLVPIIREGGLRLDGTAELLVPQLLLVGRNEAKLRTLVERAGVECIEFTTDLSAALSDSRYELYFDAQTTGRRAYGVRAAVAAGKHIYCEKPVASTSAEARELADLCEKAGVKNGVVQDKLFLPGVIKLQRAIEKGFFGKILSVRGEFGYWVFEGDGVPANRPSWNYRKREGGGIIVDMLAHWRYVLDNLIGKVQAVSCLGAVHIPVRVDEEGASYTADADDAAYATFQLEGGIVAQFNSSWVTRVRREDLLTLQVDGTHGSARVGLRDCWLQHYANTPKPVWNPDEDSSFDFINEGWSKVPDQEEYPNAFRAEWELFLQHCYGRKQKNDGRPFCYSLREGVKGVQLAELGLESWRQRRWIDVPS